MKKNSKRHHLEASKGAAASTSTQPNIVQIFNAQRKLGNSDNSSKKVALVIVQMIATDNLPFTVVSGVGYKRVVTLLKPRYFLKTEKYYCTDLFEDVHTKVENKIKELVMLENAGPYLDCWSGDAESLISLTCHFIDSDWERKQMVLNVKAMHGATNMIKGIRLTELPDLSCSACHALAPGTLSNSKEWMEDEHATLSEAKKPKRASSEDRSPDPK